MFVEPHGALPGQAGLARVVVEEVRPFARLDAAVEITQPPRRIGAEVESFGLDLRPDPAIGSIVEGVEGVEGIEARSPVVPQPRLASLAE